MVNVISCFGNDQLVVSVREMLNRNGYPNGHFFLIKAEIQNKRHNRSELYGLDYCFETLKENQDAIVIFCSCYKTEFFLEHKSEDVREKFNFIISCKRCRFLDLSDFKNIKEIANLYRDLSGLE